MASMLKGKGNPMQILQMMGGQNPQLNQALCGVVRYPNATTYSAGFSPYFNTGCGCCGTTV
jgi:hypothetical protein